MARLRSYRTPEEIKKMAVSSIREEYNKLAFDYARMVDNKVLLCPGCNNWQGAEEGFYMDRRYATNRYPLCKRCVLKMVEQRQKDTDEPNETKESVQRVLQMMDKMYDDKFYEDCVKSTLDGVNEKQRHSPFTTFIVGIQSLPQYRGKTWKDSNFGDAAMSVDEEETRIIQKTVKAGKKIFGLGFSNEDYMYLMNQYEDWQARTQVDSKSQETYITQICLQLLDIDKDRKSGKDVSNKLKALDALMNAANLQPKQNVSNAATDSLTFGQLIEKWENEKPIPEPDPEFKDVNNIGKLLRVYFAGHLSKALGLKNSYSKEYEEEMNKYTVEPPKVGEDVTSETYKQIFGVDE